MNRFRIASALLILLFAATAGRAQLDTAWVRKYDGGQSGDDWITDMVVGEDGSVYVAGCAVTGTALEDIVVRKYDSTGTLVWTDTYAGSGNGEDSAAAMVLDGSGNLYVCGWSTETAAGMEMVTMRYDAGGTRVWTSTYGRYAAEADAAYDICLTSDAVVVTGFVSDSDPWNTDYCTIWYDPADGDTIRVRYYNKTPEYDEDVAVAVCASGIDDVYVTGYSYDGDTDYDVVTVKYYASGTRHWTRRYVNIPYEDEDLGVDIAWDPVSNAVIVGGIVFDDIEDVNYLVVKYEPDGDSAWSREYDRYPAHDEDILTAVAVDDSGNVYATGTSFDDSTDYDMATVKYARDGFPIWTGRFDLDELEDGGMHLAVDSQRNVLVTGFGEELATDADIALVKYGPGGDQRWSWTYGPRPVNFEDYGHRVAVGTDGHIYVAGGVVEPGTWSDFVLLKLYEMLHDIAVEELLVPDSLWRSDSLAPRAVVANLGVFDDSCWVTLVNEWADYGESAWVVLDIGATDTVEFSTWHPETTGVAELWCWSELAGDIVPGNDTAGAAVIVWDDTSGIDEERFGPLARFDMRLAPNPAAAMAFVRFALPGPEDGVVRLYDVTGALVGPEERVRATGAGVPRQKRLDVSRLPSGVYFLKLVRGEEEVTRKLVVQH